MPGKAGLPLKVEMVLTYPLAYREGWMRRRAFIAGLGSTAGWPMLARGQSRKIPVVGVLWHAGSADEEEINLSMLRKGLNDLGYIEDRNIVLQNRFAAEVPQRYPVLAQELISLSPDVLVAVTPPAAVAVQQQTKSIPTVFVIYPDPLGTNLVSSIARPGGNITGFTCDAGDLAAKRIEILKDGLPRLSRIGLLVPPSASQKAVIERTEEVAASWNVAVEVLRVISPNDVGAALARTPVMNLDVLYVPPSGIAYTERARIAAHAIRNRLPTMFGMRENVDAGGLFSYGPSYRREFYRAATYIDKILRGEKPADLPVQQPDTFEFIVNQRTARAIGFELSPAFLSRADEVIE